MVSLNRIKHKILIYYHILQYKLQLIIQLLHCQNDWTSGDLDYSYILQFLNLSYIFISLALFINYQILAHMISYQLNKNSAYSSKHVHLCIKISTYYKRKVIPVVKFVNQYKIVSLKKQYVRVVASLVSLTNLKKLTNRRMLYCLVGLLKTCYKRNGHKSGLFNWFLSPWFGYHEYTYEHMHIAILCLKVK